MHNHPKILAAIQTEIWAITPEALNQIIAIAQGLGDPEAVAAKLGRQLTNTHSVSVRDAVATIPVIGPIFRYADIFTQISGATSIQTLATDLQTAVDDPAIKAIILEIDSPGGMIAGVSEFAAQVRAANSIKPVTAYVSDKGASAAYWIASAAGEIVAADTAQLGSIGVVMQASIDSDENTIKFISSQSPLKQADATTDAGKIQAQKTVDNLAEVFINAVAGYRGTTRENIIANYGMGGLHIASLAVASGMADKIGSYEALFSNSISTTLRTNTMSAEKETLTTAILQQDHPDLVKALIDEGYATGFKAGGDSERQRIQAIEALATLGHDDVVASFKFDGTTTAADAALQILAAEKETRKTMQAKIAADTPNPVHHAAMPQDNTNESSGLTGEDKWRYEFAHDANIKDEFRSVESYIAFCKASAGGLVKILGAQAA
jgi:ClpP class serine protease